MNCLKDLVSLPVMIILAFLGSGCTTLMEPSLEQGIDEISAPLEIWFLEDSDLQRAAENYVAGHYAWAAALFDTSAKQTQSMEVARLAVLGQTLSKLLMAEDAECFQEVLAQLESSFAQDDITLNSMPFFLLEPFLSRSKELHETTFTLKGVRMTRDALAEQVSEQDMVIQGLQRQIQDLEKLFQELEEQKRQIQLR